MVLLLLKSLLDNFRSCNDSFFHLLHHFILNVVGNNWILDGLIRWESSLLQERLQIIIHIIFINFIFHFVPIFFEFFARFVIQSLFNGQNPIPNPSVLLCSRGFDLTDWLIGLFFHFQQFLMFLLSDRIVAFFLVGLNFSQSHYLISWILFPDGLNLAIIHVVNHNNLFLRKVNSHFGNLFFGKFHWIFFKLPWHLENAHLTNMIIVVERVFGSIHFILFCFDECDTLRNEPIISVGVQLDSSLSDLFDSLDQAVRISIGVIFDDSHSSVHFDYLFPMRHLPWTIIFYCLKLIWITVFFLQFVASVLVKVTDLSNLNLFVILRS